MGGRNGARDHKARRGQGRSKRLQAVGYRESPSTIGTTLQDEPEHAEKYDYYPEEDTAKRSVAITSTVCVELKSMDIGSTDNQEDTCGNQECQAVEHAAFSTDVYKRPTHEAADIDCTAEDTETTGVTMTVASGVDFQCMEIGATSNEHDICEVERATFSIHFCEKRADEAVGDFTTSNFYSEETPNRGALAAVVDSQGMDTGAKDDGEAPCGKRAALSLVTCEHSAQEAVNHDHMSSTFHSKEYSASKTVAMTWTSGLSVQTTTNMMMFWVSSCGILGASWGGLEAFWSGLGGLLGGLGGSWRLLGDPVEGLGMVLGMSWSHLGLQGS